MSDLDRYSTAALPEVAAQIVRGLMGVRVRSSELLKQGLMTFKCRVLTESGDDLVVRFYPANRSNVVNQEPDLIDRCRRIGLPVPMSIGDSRTGPTSPLAYVAYRWIGGKTLQEVLAIEDKGILLPLAEELARHLGSLREIQFQGAGELASATRARSADWESFVKQSMRVGLAAVRKHALLDVPLVDDIAWLVEGRQNASVQETHSLVWGDINFGNVLVGDDGRISGLIDFESCLSGDPLATLGYAHAAHGSHPFISLLLQNWPRPLTDRDLDQVAVYAILRALRLAPYAHLPLPTGHPRDPLVAIFSGIVPALQRLTRKH